MAASSLRVIVALAAILSGPPALAQTVKGPGTGPPPDWPRTKDQIRELTFAGEDAQVVAIMEKIVAAHPGFAEGHARLGGAHESVARAVARKDRALAARHFETAALHLRHAFERGGGEYPDATIRGLIDLYEYALPSPEKWKATVLDALVRYPAEPAAQWYGVQLVLREGRIGELDAALRKARAALPPAADPRLEYASLLTSLAQKNAQPAVRAALVREALSLVDDVIKKNPADRIVRRKADAIKEDLAGIKSK
jgi:hypothetical protein